MYFKYLGPNTFNENETIAKYEIMDGAPVRGMYMNVTCRWWGYEILGLALHQIINQCNILVMLPSS